MADISAYWSEVGLALKVSSNDLQSIRDMTGSTKVKLSEVINSWMDTKSSPFTWKNLILAIEGPIVNNKSKADEIREYLRSNVQ